MGRKKSAETKEKRTPIKLEPVLRKHAGKITEPYVLLERLSTEMSSQNPARFGHLDDVKITLWWTKDWKLDPDGIATGAQVCKANELDRNLVESAGGETPDVFIKLPKLQWPNLADDEREQRMFHELCHIRPALDTNGNQKRDAKNRLLWRLGRHPISTFPEEVDRFGIEKVLGHNERIKVAAESVDKPMLKAFDEAEKKTMSGPDGWKKMPLAALDLPAAVEQYVYSAGFTTLGKLADHQNRSGDFWDKDISVGGERKPPKFREKIEAGWTQFWADHPEYCQPAVA